MLGRPHLSHRGAENERASLPFAISVSPMSRGVSSDLGDGNPVPHLLFLRQGREGESLVLRVFTSLLLPSFLSCYSLRCSF